MSAAPTRRTMIAGSAALLATGVARAVGDPVVVCRAGRFAGESPRDGENQFFGHVQLGEDNSFTASLRNANGATVFSKVLTPER